MSPHPSNMRFACILSMLNLGWCFALACIQAVMEELSFNNRAVRILNIQRCVLHTV
jgi:hypothetical protein